MIRKHLLAAVATFGALFLLIFLSSLCMPSAGAPHPVPKIVQEKNQAYQIGLILLLYANDHDGRFPDSLDPLFDFSEAPPHEELAQLLYRPGTKEYRWALTPGLTLSSPAITVLLESTGQFARGTRIGSITFTLGGNTEWTGSMKTPPRLTPPAGRL